MAKMTKTQAKKRLNEAQAKVKAVYMATLPEARQMGIHRIGLKV